jgi:hypothetical protein
MQMERKTAEVQKWMLKLEWKDDQPQEQVEMKVETGVEGVVEAEQELEGG